MKYTVTCLTPTLVGDGHKLAPIDYMVWKDQVNILDQTRIFRILSKGPRLEGYLRQLKTATRLDFASWGGFAQNYAGRRIPFENASCSEYWNRAPVESLSIPTFAEGVQGSFLPGAAVKGALRTGLLVSGLRDNALPELAARYGGTERAPRRPGELLEEQAVGTRTRFFGAADSAAVSPEAFKVYLVRTSTLQPKGPNYQVAWKQAPRGAVNRAEDSTPAFMEMAAPGTQFTGAWNENQFLNGPEVRRVLRWRDPMSRAAVFQAANQYAAKQLDAHARYAEWTNLPALAKQIASLKESLTKAEASGNCLLSIGWGAGFLGKTALLDTSTDDARKILQAQNTYASAIRSGLPFPKTRRIVFLNNQPASLPGWVLLQAE